MSICMDIYWKKYLFICFFFFFAISLWICHSISKVSFLMKNMNKICRIVMLAKNSNQILLSFVMPSSINQGQHTRLMEKVISFRDTGNGSSLHIWSLLLHSGLSCPHQRTIERLIASQGLLRYRDLHLLPTTHSQTTLPVTGLCQDTCQVVFAALLQLSK